ncbi:kinesin light chain [Ceratobasidium sp. AG-Ba]|nr:kinesin light chain [Ceratobasidium sp. AG-Ba]
MSETKRRDTYQGVNILVLEGGGARGLSSLMILNEIMGRLQHARGLDNLPRVQDCFDVVAGTGTGAVIACMVGRLGIPVDQAIEHYSKLAEVFSERKLIGATAYKTTKLQNVVRNIVRDATGNENTGLMDTSTDAVPCKTMVFAMSKHNMEAGIPRVFRSYSVVANRMPDCAIWEAVCASMAHPELFKAVEIGQGPSRESFVDGGLRCTNPVAHVLTEAKALFPNRKLSALVCLGAGHPSTIAVPDGRWFDSFVARSLLAMMKQISSDAEQTAQDMSIRFRSAPGVYFRFSVDQDMQSVGSADWEKLSHVTAHTRAYTQRNGTSSELDRAVCALAERNGQVSMTHIDGEINTMATQRPVGVKSCPDPTPVFTGRQDTIDQVVACISMGDIQRCVFVLHGLGGSGKTQLALKTVEQTREIWSDVVFVDATTHETANKALSDFAKEKDIGESHESAVKWLGNQRERWLMVIDNADDPKVDIRRYFPSGRIGSILVTTRIDHYALLAQGPNSDHRVASMRLEEAMQLLVKTARMDLDSLPSTEREAGVQLLESVGCLALAIVQAGAYIFSSKRTISQYLEMFIEHRQDALEKYNQLLVRVDDYQKSVYTTWHMSYVLLSSDAQVLLHLMAYMHHSDILEDIFRLAAISLSTYDVAIQDTEAEAETRTHLTQHLRRYLDSSGAWNSGAFLETMTGLLSYSLISYDQANRAYTLHVLVHDWAMSVTNPTISVTIDHAALLLAFSIDYDDRIENLEYKRKVEAHVNRVVEKQPNQTANNAARFQDVYWCTGQWGRKLMMDQIVLSGRRQALGEENDGTLNSMAHLAYSYRSLGQYEDAVEIQKHVVALRDRLHGSEHRDTLIDMRNLARTYYELGRYKDTQSLQTLILDTSVRVYGHDDPDTLVSMHDLAVTHQVQGRYDEAEVLLIKVLNAKKRFKGDEHPETLASMNALASTYNRQGRHDEAESMQEHLLKVLNADYIYM